MAPTKAFNIPGVGCAFAIIEDPEMRGGGDRDPLEVPREGEMFGDQAEEEEGATPEGAAAQ